MKTPSQKPALASHIQRRDYFSRRVESVCPQCLQVVPGALCEQSDGLVMEKTCPKHGSFQSTVAPDLASYRQLCRAPRKVTRPRAWGAETDRGCPHDCGLCPAHDQHTCLAILEITSRCDLACPVCLAGSRPQGEDLALHQIEPALRRLLAYQGGLPPIQLGGGEPTGHPKLPEIITLVRSLGGDRIELDTNGLALAKQPGLAAALREAGLSGVYLQMDTLEPATSLAIRGRDLVADKLAAIANSRRAGLEIVLSVTVVPGLNDHELWPLVRFALEQRLTGVNFQALTLSGRYPPEMADSQRRLTAGHFKREMARQSGGKLMESDLAPIPCPDPRCGLLTYALVIHGDLLPLGRLFGDDQLVDCLADLKDWPQTIRHLDSEGTFPSLCSCAGPVPQDLPSFLAGADFFSIGFHGMMDVFSLDLARAKRCCVHLLQPDGRLIPFCLYNALYRGTSRPLREGLGLPVGPACLPVPAR